MDLVVFQDPNVDFVDLVDISPLTICKSINYKNYVFIDNITWKLGLKTADNF